MSFEQYPAVHSSFFIRIEVAEYRNYGSTGFTSELLTFSDHYNNIIIDGVTYVPLGSHLSITETVSELVTSRSQVNITLSGVPDSALYEIMNSRIKGSPVIIYRGVFEAGTNTVLNAGSIADGRFRGIVTNYLLNEQYDNDARTSINTITLACAGKVEQLQNKIAGRKTNPSSMRLYFPDDESFDRVPSLENTQFNFGEDL